MPELPEVETVMRGLCPPLLGQVLVRVTLARQALRFRLPERLAQRLTGRRVLGMARRGKYILARLDGNETLLVHLGMSGRMILDPSDPPPAHAHLLIETGLGRRIAFVDPRRFGSLDLVDSRAEATHPRLRRLGPEPLGDRFTPAVLSAALAGRASTIKAALLDQTVVAGLGNIYVAEALFRARISPRRQAHGIVGRRAARLVPAIKDVLSEAIAAGGSSLRDHVQPNGELGYFQHAWRVYGRAGMPCPDCPGRPACPGIARIEQAGRSTFYCPRLQR
ncbi:MAG: bifunctional DNA-formamidopyrimidine glycosylase/DNA-(apurinic or apyrimidinic site) lyase [Acetobacteraceae bacterium]|nr:bifunctional DNA-formamidopyrimidine glycosylase/DNA-(apurinic or apyrimidinic site) lyase [Acetobacteraceae bacterium]